MLDIKKASFPLSNIPSSMVLGTNPTERTQKQFLCIERLCMLDAANIATISLCIKIFLQLFSM
jgi:hypothetical protein